MFRSIFLIVSLLFFYSNVFAQSKLMKWGVVPKEHLEMTVAPFDSAAHAVVLSEYGAYEFSRTTFPIRLYYTKRVKLMDTDGIDEFGTVKIPFYQKDGKENITKIRAHVIKNKGGVAQKIEVPKKNIVKDEGMYGWADVKIAFPQLEVGDIIEWKYTFNSARYWAIDPWKFQSDYPTIRSEVVVKSIDSSLDFKFFLNGSNSKSLYDKSKSKFLLENQPPLKDEPFVANPDDYKDIVYFQLAGYKKFGSTVSYESFLNTWDELASDYYLDTDVRTYFRDRKYEDILALIPKGESDIDYIKNIRSYAVSNFGWNDRWGISPKQTYNELLKSKSGSIPELNLHLCGLLQAAGFKVTPLLISSRSNGKLFSIAPLLTQFDYLLCYLELDDKNYVLDATHKNLPYNVLPKEAWVEKGLYLVKKEAKIIDLDVQGTKFINRNNILVEVKSDGTLEASANNIYSGYNSVNVRSGINNKGLEEYLEQRIYEEEAELDSSSVTNLADPEKPLSVFSRVIKEVGKGKVFIQPKEFFPLRENPFTQEKRFLPIEIANDRAIRSSIQFKVPEGYEITSFPEVLNITLPSKIGKFTFISKKSFDRELQMMIMFNLKKVTVNPEYYQYFREFYIQLLAKLNESIVISPVKGELNQ
ncbi:DUF3857 domain-containing protein [Sediminitomix flava]|uniref:Uncharacterized protein DUF3857 n=1 Tax=Sediminitomix flava TaxID=379075 RepID=A0A315Z9L3_SEDFL|nr:DUF3857 domain-containing protein [Sediminitomix flava]PWJ42201.1 uncharacterized protein DUF3857 [Sediminitomix flava]